MAAITVVLPTRNRAKLLIRSIESILNQTHVDIRLLILDNFSSDETHQVCNYYQKKDNRVSFIRHATDIGAANNFLFGMNKVETDYFALISDDDLMLPNFLSKSLQLLQQDSSVGFSIMDTLFFNEHDHLTSLPKSDKSVRLCSKPDRILFQAVPMTWTSMLFRREVLETFIPSFDPLDKGLDIRLLRCAAAKFPYIYLSEPGACFMVHKGSFSTAGFPVSEKTAYYAQIANRFSYIVHLDDVTPDIKALCNKILTYMFTGGFRDSLRNEAISSLKNYLIAPSSALKSQLIEYKVQLLMAKCYLMALMIDLTVSERKLVRHLRSAVSVFARYKRNRIIKNVQLGECRDFAEEIKQIKAYSSKAHELFRVIVSPV